MNLDKTKQIRVKYDVIKAWLNDKSSDCVATVYERDRDKLVVDFHLKGYGDIKKAAGLDGTPYQVEVRRLVERCVGSEDDYELEFLDGKNFRVSWSDSTRYMMPSGGGTEKLMRFLQEHELYFWLGSNNGKTYLECRK